MVTFRRMNFLAHLFLSGNDAEVQLGNFLAEGIRTKAYLDFPKGIQRGILLHREIDTFTDAHPFFRQSTKRLHASYHHYAPVVVDLYYDHFLAKNWNVYSKRPLAEVVQNFYKLLSDNSNYFTQKAHTVVPYMIKYNWLVSYESIHGLGTIFRQMDARTKFLSGMSTATEELTADYSLFEEEFTKFFPEIQSFCEKKLKEL